MGKDTRHRKYQLTINNPGETWTHEKIKTALKTLNLKYYCMADETGQQEQTPHTHIYLVTNVSAIRFSTVKSLFPTASGMVLAKIIFCVVCLQVFVIDKKGMSNYVLLTRARTSPAPFFRLRPGASGSR